MLVISLVISGIVLLVAIPTARYLKSCAVWIGLVGFGLPLALAMLGALVYSPVLQTAMLLGVFGQAKAGGRSWLWVSAISTVCTVLAYAVTGTIALLQLRTYDELREQYPYESMVARVPDPKPVPSEPEMTANTAARLANLEEQIADQS